MNWDRMKIGCGDRKYCGGTVRNALMSSSRNNSRFYSGCLHFVMRVQADRRINEYAIRLWRTKVTQFSTLSCDLLSSQPQRSACANVLEDF